MATVDIIALALEGVETFFRLNLKLSFDKVRFPERISGI
jgi:hypothetical protein